MNDLITAATSGLFVEVGKVIEHMKAQQARIVELEKQLIETQQECIKRGHELIDANATLMAKTLYETDPSAPAVEQQPETDRVSEIEIKVSELRAELMIQRDTTETYGYSSETARVAIEGCINTLDEIFQTEKK